MIIKHDLLKQKMIRHLKGIHGNISFKEFQKDFRYINNIKLQPTYAKKLLKEIKKENPKININYILFPGQKAYKIRKGVKVYSKL